MTYAFTWRHMGLVAALLLTLNACGDSRAETNVDIDDRITNPGDNNDNPPNFNAKYFLAANGSSDLVVGAGSSAPVSVFLYDKETNDPVKDERISFKLAEDASDEVFISALNAVTQESGEASVDFKAGPTLETVTLVASHPSANDVEFTINVESLPTGSIRVKTVNAAPSVIALNNIEVRLHDYADFSCADFRPLGTQADGIEIKTLPNEAQLALFEELAITKKYVVTARARGPRNQIAAGGCSDDLRVEDNGTTNVELALSLIPINPAGRYNVTSNWDFSEALADSGAVGATIVRILNVFQNPGQGIYDEIINLVRNAVGGIIAGTLSTFLNLTGLDDTFEDLINDAVANNSVLSNLQSAGLDLRAVVTNLEVLSVLAIGKSTSDYEFRGTDNWLGINLYWRQGCDQVADPICGQIPIRATDGSTFADLGVLSSNWTGRVVGYDQLQIDEHPITLRYGRLLIYVLNEIILPSITNGNANSLTEAFSYWINCRGLALGITGTDGEICALSACIQASQLEGFCSGTISTLFGFADALITNLEFDANIRVGGDATLIEEDSDGFVDLMEMGTYRGYLNASSNNGGQQGLTSPVTATWSATKLDSNITGL